MSALELKKADFLKRLEKKKLRKLSAINWLKLMEKRGYFESASVLDKYWKRPLGAYNDDVKLDSMSLAQFIKRTTKGALKMK